MRKKNRKLKLQLQACDDDSSGDKAMAMMPIRKEKLDAPPAKPYSTGDALLDLIALQLFDGSWDPAAPGFYQLILATAVNNIDGEAEKRCREFCTAEGQRRATALAIVAMRIGQADRRQEWAMIEEKAVDWLEEDSSDTHAATTVAKLLEDAENLVLRVKTSG